MSETRPTHIGELMPQDGKDYECSCARCGSSLIWERCEHCEDGMDGHDCGEDCCSCLDAEPNVPCQICRGRGRWWVCLSSAEFCEKNPLAGRENVSRGTLEWYEVAGA